MAKFFIMSVAYTSGKTLYQNIRLRSRQTRCFGRMSEPPFDCHRRPFTAAFLPAVWLAVSSELSHYRSLYGPQVLLHLNIAYYVPSIPLLIFQSFFDERLEAAFGVSRTILSRLIFGLVGYAAVSAYFPFMPQSET